MDRSTSGSTKSDWFSCENVLQKRNCSYCGFTTYLKITLNDHMWNHHRSFQNNRNTEIKQYSCKNCNLTSYSLLVWHLHQNKCIPISFMEENKRPGSSEKSEETLLKHHTVCLDTVPEKNNLFERELCNYKVKAETYLSGHTPDDKITFWYIDSDKFICCKLCEYKARRRCDFGQHFERRHTDPKDRVRYKCNQCSFESFTKRYVNGHAMREHSNPEEIKWFECSQCNYKSLNSFVLKSHVRENHSVETQMYECSHCFYKTVVEKKMNRHMFKHHKEIKVFECDQCEYKAKTRYSLSKHIRYKHSGEQAQKVYHECNQCSYKSHYKIKVREHIISRHTDPKDIKWFECDKCEYKAKLKASLNHHIKVKHTEGQVYHECRQCSYKTVSKTCLKKHVISHHTDPEDVKWHHCDRCEYKVMTRGTLRRHLRKKHSTKHTSEDQVLRK